MAGYCSIIPIVHFVIHLVYQMSFSEAFTSPCSVSQKTITPVLECPANSSSFETSAKRKNCSSMAAEAKDCTSFQYHCVLEEDLTSAIELCAPSINIIDNVCTIFSNYHKSIIRAQELNCSECPWSYNSTNAYQFTQITNQQAPRMRQYKQCYTYVNQHITTELTVRYVLIYEGWDVSNSTIQNSRSANQTMMESRDQKTNAIFYVFAVVFAVCVVGAIYSNCSRLKHQNESANEGQNKQISKLDQEPAIAHEGQRSAEDQVSVSISSDEDGNVQKISKYLRF